jgi:hypothetical protein
MSSLIPTEATKTTRVKALSSGQRAFLTFNMAVSAGMTALPIVFGDPAMFLLPAVLLPVWTGIAGHFANRRLKDALGSWEVTDAPKFPALRLWGKNKSYQIAKKDRYGQVVKGRYAIGAGSAYILETVPSDPIDMWDSSMKAVKEVYELTSKTEQERELSRQRDHASGWRDTYHHEDYRDEIDWMELLHDRHYDETVQERYYRQEKARKIHSEAKKRQATKKQAS